MINTADAMLGYHTPELEWFGKMAARSDDLFNIVPSRIAAAMICMMASAGKGSSNRAATVALRDASRTASPNAGWPMAAMAGALDIRLTKRGHYALHDRGQAPVAADIERSCQIAFAAAVLAALLVDLGMISPRPEIDRTDVAEHGGRHALAHGADRVAYDFSSCLNAFGAAEVVTAAIVQARVGEDPDPTSRAARRAAAARWMLSDDEIGFGAGSAELIQAACFAYLRLGDTVIIATPAFGEYPRAASLCGARVLSVSGENLATAVDCHRPRMVFLASPANPTGTTYSLDALGRVANACLDACSLLVLDHAYDAFAASPLGTPAIRGHPNVLHLRSLTKDHAIAGVRAAFAVSVAEVIRAVERARVPWSATTSAQSAAVAAMTDEAVSSCVTRTTAILRAEAGRLRQRCLQLGFASSDSSTHYFTLHVGDAPAVHRALLDRAGIAVRDCTSFSLPDQIRVAARTRPETTPSSSP